jgi:flagellar hook assembly protein FlgD
VENPLSSVEIPNSKSKIQKLICFPNPFTDKTTIEFTLDQEYMVNLSIYNLKGEPIKTLTNSSSQKGTYTHTWDGTDQFGKEVSSGVYIISLVAGRQKQRCRIVYAK